MRSHPSRRGVGLGEREDHFQPGSEPARPPASAGTKILKTPCA
jgi:hypothetical protein